MPLTTSNPTSNSSPDAGQGGSAVTTPSNTGHALTATNTSNGASLTRSAIWTAFSSVGGTITSINLKADWSINGLLEAAGVNEFRFQYSVDNGSNWLNAVTRSNVTAADTGTFNVALSAAQDIAQVQMRVRYTATADSGIGIDANISGTISTIRLEVVTAGASSSNRAAVCVM